MFFAHYLLWHYTAGLRQTAFLTLAYPLAFLDYFSVRHLARTLFSTWHHDLMSYGRGFDPAEFFWVMTSNILSRIIGAIVRAIVITIGALTAATAFFIRAAWLFLWLILPILIPFLFARGIILLFG